MTGKGNPPRALARPPPALHPGEPAISRNPYQPSAFAERCVCVSPASAPGPTGQWGQVGRESWGVAHSRPDCASLSASSPPCSWTIIPALRAACVSVSSKSLACDLAQTKHPRVLAFEWSGETEAGGAVVVYLATEPVEPLATALAGLALEGEQREMYLALGLRQAAQGAAFLTNQCKAIHGNVCMASVLVTPELDWRLGFLDMLSEHAHLSSSLLARCGARLMLRPAIPADRLGRQPCGLRERWIARLTWL